MPSLKGLGIICLLPGTAVPGYSLLRPFGTGKVSPAITLILTDQRILTLRYNQSIPMKAYVRYVRPREAFLHARTQNLKQSGGHLEWYDGIAFPPERKRFGML